MIEIRYFKQGTTSVDEDSPMQPVQGLTLAIFSYDLQANDWKLVQRNAAGDPYFGYKAVEISKEEFDLWSSRIAGAAASAVVGKAGYEDSGGLWYPGRIGHGISAIDKDAQAVLLSQDVEALEKRVESEKQAKTVTPRQAREWLILNDLDEALEAGILSIGDSGEPDAVKQSKLMWNWYEMSGEWAYGNAQLVAAFQFLGINRDKFFAEAAKL